MTIDDGQHPSAWQSSGSFHRVMVEVGLGSDIRRNFAHRPGHTADELQVPSETWTQL